MSTVMASTVMGIRFVAGRYHATPWGLHANEAQVEWPPSPWRILRAFVAAWHRKMDVAQYPEELLSALIETLAATDPVYHLPGASRSHTRHYMPVRAGAADRPVLVFDAFARVAPHDELVVAWDDVLLDPAERDLLAALIHVTGYLGRAESWTEGRLMQAYDGPFNCVPIGTAESLGGLDGMPVSLIAPMSASDYGEWRSRCIVELGLDAKRLTRTQRRTLDLIPVRLIDALRAETGTLRSAEWNLPPGSRMVTYERLTNDTADRAPLRQRAEPPSASATTVRLALHGRPLPRIEDALRIGEVMRKAAISKADGLSAGAGAPAVLSGHDLPSDANHTHAFYLPEDADGDGFIDHVVIHASAGLSTAAVVALNAIPKLWTDDGAEWRVVFIGSWRDPEASGSHLCGKGRTWISTTPYLHPWHAKRRFGIAEQIRRECAQRGLPDPAQVRVLPSIRIRDRERCPVHFHRVRSKRGLSQPDRRGSMVELEFSETVAGPLALGFGCHYGLGMFTPRP